MPVEPIVRFLDQLPVKTPFANAGLITSHKQDGSPFGIESKCDSPHPFVCIEAKLLHVGVARPFQCVHARAAQSRAENLQHPCLGKQLVLNQCGQCIKLRVEGRIEKDLPPHGTIMILSAYAVKGIC